nr:hypothetical protein Itr_chr06CG05560 [Ipomoea trifida]
MNIVTLAFVCALLMMSICYVVMFDILECSISLFDYICLGFKCRTRCLFCGFKEGYVFSML